MKNSFLLIASSLFIWGVGEGMFIFFQPLYLQELGADPLLIGTVLGVVGISMTIAHLPAGYLADRIGRRPLMVAAWCIGTIAVWIMALAVSLPGFILGASIYGTTAFVAGPMNSYITAAKGKWTVARALTIVFSTYNAGAVVGSLLGGIIGDKLGLRFSFIISGILLLISTILIFNLKPQPVETFEQVEKQNRWSEFQKPRFILFIAIIFFATYCMFIPQPLSQNFLLNERNLSLSQIGWLISARSAGVVVFNLILGQINARYGYLLAQSSMALFTILVWRGTGIPWYLLGYFMLGSYQTARTLASAQVRALVQARNMGLAFGILETIGGMAFIFAPPFAGYLYAISPEAPYWFGLTGICAAFLLSFFFIPLKPSEIT